MNDAPEPGRIYSLTGRSDEPSIHRGDTWAESEMPVYRVVVSGAQGGRNFEAQMTADLACRWGRLASIHGFYVYVEPVN
jgi:hypothetical protein